MQQSLSVILWLFAPYIWLLDFGKTLRLVSVRSDFVGGSSGLGQPLNMSRESGSCQRPWVGRGLWEDIVYIKTRP